MGHILLLIHNFGTSYQRWKSKILFYLPWADFHWNHKRSFGICMGQFFKIFPDLSQNWANWYMDGSCFLEKLVFIWVYFQILWQHDLPKPNMSTPLHRICWGFFFFCFSFFYFFSSFFKIPNGWQSSRSASLCKTFVTSFISNSAKSFLTDPFLSYHSLRCHGIICPYLSAGARCFYTTLTENEVLPVLVDFN